MCAVQHPEEWARSGPSLRRARTADLGGNEGGRVEGLRNSVCFFLTVGVGFSSLRVMDSMQIGTFAARFGSGCETGCERGMAQRSGIVGQEHIQARPHKRPIRFVGVDTTPAAFKYLGAALDWSKPPATLRVAVGLEVAGPLPA
jgi:hypothetical protein